MYAILLNMWKSNKLTDVQLQNAATKGWITEAQAQMIQESPKNVEA